MESNSTNGPKSPLTDTHIFDPLSPSRIYEPSRTKQTSTMTNPFDDLFMIADKQNADVFLPPPVQQPNRSERRRMDPRRTTVTGAPSNNIIDTDVPGEFEINLDLEYLDKPKKSTTLPRSEAKTAPNNLYDDAPFDDQDDNHLNAGNNFFISPEKKMGSLKSEKAWDPTIKIDNVLSIPAKTAARKDLENMAWSGPDKWTKSKSVSDMICFFNQITLWVSHEILECQDAAIRIKKLCRFIDIAKYLVENNNYNGAKSIISGLEHSPVHRLKETWTLISKHEQGVFEKITEILSPQENAINYRKRLKKQPKHAAIIPFLGIHLGDLIYLNEAKKQLMSKKDMQGAIQKESEIARTIDQLELMQSKCIYEIEEIPPVRAMFMQEKFITEFQNFVEDLHFSKSYQIEPKKLVDTLSPPGTAVTHKLSLSDPIDLISASVDELSKSLSINDLASEVGHSRSNSASDRPNSGQSTTSITSPKKGASSQAKGFLFGSVGRKVGKESAASIKEEYEHSVHAETASNQSVRSVSERTADDFFDTKDVLKECMMNVKVKREDGGGKLQKTGGWEQCFVRIKSKHLLAYRKTPLNNSGGGSNKPVKGICMDIPFDDASKVEVATDYKKKPNVLRLRVNDNLIVLLEAKDEAEMYQTLVTIQKCTQ